MLELFLYCSDSSIIKGLMNYVPVQDYNKKVKQKNSNKNFCTNRVRLCVQCRMAVTDE